jgi:hypothetical protein
MDLLLQCKSRIKTTSWLDSITRYIQQSKAIDFCAETLPEVNEEIHLANVINFRAKQRRIKAVSMLSAM